MLAGKLNKVVPVHPLREVVSQVGFTRFEPAQPDVNDELLNARPGLDGAAG
jgi:hypothetical protein